MIVQDWISIEGVLDLPTPEEWSRDFDNGLRYIAIEKGCGEVSEMTVHEGGAISLDGWGDNMREVPRHFAILTNFAWTKIPVFKKVK